MVGRTVERVLLREHLASVNEGRGRFVMIGGEAGIGKTTLTRDLIATALASAHTILIGNSYDLMAAAPYSLWLDFAARYRQSSSSTDMPPVPRALASHTLEGFSSQAELFAQMIAFLRQASADHPALVVLEDIHWADPASLELLRHIASHLEQLRILLVVTYRVDELTQQNPFYLQFPALIRESEGLRIDLKRLTVREVREVITLRYGMPDDDRDRLVDYVEHYAEGNPFFAMELLRTLEAEDESGLSKTESGWSLAELHRVIMPALVRQVIDARVAKLGEDTQHPLTVAAVIGQEVPLDLWASIAGIDHDTMCQIIDNALNWHVFNAAADGTRIHFVHALIREALYESILPPRRRRMHQSVAEALMRHSDPDSDAIAFHLQQAGDDRAPEWLIQAGDRAQRAYAWLTAMDRFAEAARLLQNVPGEEGARARLLYRCGRLQRYSHTQTGITNLHSATQLAEIAGNTMLAADAIYSRGLLQCFADDWQPGLANMIQGVERLEALPPKEARISWSTANWMADALPEAAMPDSADLDPAADKLAAAGINHRRGSLPWFLAAVGRFTEAREIARIYRTHVTDAGLGPLALSNLGHMAFGLGITHASLGLPDDARKAFAAAHDTYVQIDHHAVIAFAHLSELMDVSIPYRTRNYLERRQLADAAQSSLAKARGAFASGMSERLAQLAVMYLDGRWSEARAIAAESSSHGTYILRSQLTHALAPIAWHQGHFLEAWQQVDSLLPDGPRSSPGSVVLLDALMLQRLAANLALGEGDKERARAWLEANDSWLSWSGSVLGRAENEITWSRFHRHRDESTSAWDRSERALAAAEAPHQPLALIDAHRLKGELARERGDADTAELHLAQSLNLADACHIPFQRALSLVAPAELRATTDREGAVELAREARTFCEPLEAQPTLDRIDALTANLSSTHRSPEAPAGLTRREFDVLQLVAKGLTDVEIGDQLFISSRTVSQHLRSVYGKLDVRSRTEATRFSYEHGIL
jgi:ATP/maltotriose-dependent transcriptional regulator MalT